MRPAPRDGRVPRDEDREADPRRGAGGRRQDRARQGARRRARHRADPPAVLRGPRRGQGAVRVGVRQAAALHAGAAGQDRRRSLSRPRRCTTRPSCCAARRTCSSRSVPRRAPDPARAPRRAPRRCCSSTRSTAPTRSSRRFCSSSCPTSRSSIPEIGTIRAEEPAARGADEQPLARAQRGAQAPLPAPPARLPVPGRRARDRAAQGAGDPRRARRRARRDDPAAPHGRPAQGAEHRRDPRLGAGAHRPRRRVARQASSSRRRSA